MACGSPQLVLNPKTYVQWMQSYDLELRSEISAIAMQPEVEMLNTTSWGVHDARVMIVNAPSGEGITIDVGINIDGSLSWGVGTIPIGFLDPDNGISYVTLDQEALDLLNKYLETPGFIIVCRINGGYGADIMIRGDAWFWYRG